MDDIVQAALAKWPHVPHCYGWLGLGARGQWYMRDATVQALGTFAQSRGSVLRHDKLVDFIQRNYEADAQGCWFFQNGPQRVYVELEATPLILRIADHFAVTTHSGQPAQARACLLDETGRVYLDTDRGLGLVHTLDVLVLANAVEQGLWQPQEVQAHTLAARFGYVPSPQAMLLRQPAVG